MPYLNRIEVMGNLGKDPELRYLPNQTPVTSISVAYTEKWRDKTNNEPRERIEWFTVVLYGKHVNAHVKLHQEIRVWALKSAPP